MNRIELLNTEKLVLVALDSHLNTYDDDELIIISTEGAEFMADFYKKSGLDGCLSNVEGKFAIAVYDKKNGVSYLVRDRFGELPFYYFQDSQTIYFGTHLKEFDPAHRKFTIDKVALNMFMSFSYIPAPYSIYQEVRKIMPGHYLKISEDGIITDYTYYNVINEIRTPITDKAEATKMVRELMTDSVDKLMTDNCGVFLSGGIDSSIVSCVMNELSGKPINTYSIGFTEKQFDESERAALVVDKIKSNHTRYELDYKNVLNDIDDIILYYDEPFGDSSAIPSYCVAKVASEKVKVALTGDCADELFGGYQKYTAEYYVNRYKRIPVFLRALFEWVVNHCPDNRKTARNLRRIRKVIRNAKSEGFDLYYNLMCLGFSEEDRKGLLKEESYRDVKPIYRQRYEAIPDSFSFLQKEQIMDIQGVLEGDMFPKMGKACEHNGVENRAPFFDYRLLKVALNLEDNLKVNGTNKKYILKETFRDILPEGTLTFRKTGFGVPVDCWMKNELREDMEKLISKDFIEQQGLFNYEFIRKVYDNHLNEKENLKGPLWNFYVFQKWYTKVYQVL